MKSVTIRGKRYKVIRKRLASGVDGECDHPEQLDKQIRIRRGLEGWDYLETLLHEMLHASFWDASEEAINETAADITRALKSLGVTIAHEA